MNVQRLVTLLFFATMVAACGSAPVTPPPPEKAEPVAEAPKKRPPPLPKAPKKEPAPPVLLLLSEDIPAYREVADKLLAQLQGRGELVELSLGEEGADTRGALLRQPGYQQYVAIGHAAAARLPDLLDKDDVALFCQLFNYDEIVKLAPQSKGVSAVPSAATLFSVWRQLSPELRSVGVITGPGLESVIAHVMAEAGRQGIMLQHRIVESDKEMLYVFKQLAPSIDGLWLLPDNRILSRNLLRELMSYSVYHALQLAVFNEELLKFGGLLSITADTTEIADKLLQQLQASKSANGGSGDELIPLEGGVVRINTVVAKRFNLLVSDELRETLHEP